MTAFDYALAFTLKWEGGYVNNPDDPGGKTKYGITGKTLEYAREYGITLPENVAELTEREAETIYRLLYWERLKCNRMPAWTAVVVFDTGVNQGIYWASLHLQRALNDLHHHHNRAPVYNLKEDGIIGEKTLSAVNDLRFRVLADVKRLFIRLYCVNRDLRYVELTFKNRRLQKFLKGWFLRTSDLQSYTETLLEV